LRQRADGRWQEKKESFDSCWDASFSLGLVVKAKAFGFVVKALAFGSVLLLPFDTSYLKALAFGSVLLLPLHSCIAAFCCLLLLLPFAAKENFRAIALRIGYTG